MDAMIRWRLPVLVALTVLSIVVVVVQSWKSSRVLQIETARSAAKAYAAALTEYRDFYIQEVMKEAKAANIDLPYPSHGKDGALPLAYEFAIDLGDKLATDNSGARYRIFSDFPWPERKEGGVRDNFERQALDALLAGQEEYWAVKETDQERTLVYSEPIVLKSFCADCHNKHPSSPRQGWRVGDVRGALSVELPLPSSSFVPASAGFSGFTSFVVLTATLLGGLVFVVSAYSRLAVEKRRDAELVNVLQSIADPVLVISKDGTIREANQATADVLGWAHVELIGHHACKLFPDGESSWSTTNATLVNVLGCDGQICPLTLRVRRLRDSRDEFAVSLRDESGLLEVQRRLLEAQKWETVGVVCGGIAHDFNNLMSVVLNHAELLVESPRIQDVDRVGIEQIQKSANSAARLTKQLLAYGRKQPLTPETVAVNAFLSDRESTFSKLISDHIIIIEEHPKTRMVHVDLQHLELALLNLVFNAKDASPNGSQIVIRAADSERPNMVSIDVSDSGSGISSELRSKVLEPFFSTKHSSGLGLSSVLGFAQQSGGNLEMLESPGGGCLARIFLPTANPASICNSTSETSDDATVADQKRLLLVDDNDLVRESFAALLGSLQYHVTEAASVDEAIACLKEMPAFDMHILDVRLGPNQSGLQIAETARDIYGDVPTLFISGYLECTELDAILHNERYMLLSKPISRQELKIAIANVREKHVTGTSNRSSKTIASDSLS